MTKTELMETYTAEQLADRYLNLQERFDKDTEMLNNVVKSLPEELREKTEFLFEIEKLKSEVDKYRKAFEDANKERGCRIAEYQKKIEELENRDIAELLPTDPIKVAGILINVMHEPCASVLSFGKPYSMYDISELKQIAEHLLVYCNHNGEDN